MPLLDCDIFWVEFCCIADLHFFYFFIFLLEENIKIGSKKHANTASHIIKFQQKSAIYLLRLTECQKRIEKWLAKDNLVIMQKGNKLV